MLGTKTILPIIGNCDVQNIVGKMEIIDGKAIMSFEDPIPRDWLPEGSYIVRESVQKDGKENLKEVELIAPSVGISGKSGNDDHESFRDAIKNNVDQYISACKEMNIELSDDKKALLRDFASTRSAPILEDYLNNKEQLNDTNLQNLKHTR